MLRIRRVALCVGVLVFQGISPQAAQGQLAHYCTASFDLCFNVSSFSYLAVFNDPYDTPDGVRYASWIEMGVGGSFSGSEASLNDWYIGLSGLPWGFDRDLYAEGWLPSTNLPEFFGSPESAGYKGAIFIQDGPPIEPFAMPTAATLGPFSVRTDRGASYTLVEVPEPATGLMVLTGILAMAFVVRRRKLAID